MEQIQTGIQTFMKSDAYTGIVTVLKDNPQLAESSEMQAQIKQVNAVVKKQFSALSSLGITVNTYEDLPAASAEVGKLLTKVNTGMKTIERAQQKVESGKVSLTGFGYAECQCIHDGTSCQCFFYRTYQCSLLLGERTE